MSKISFTLKQGQSFKIGDMLCHLVDLGSGTATVCVEAPRTVPVTRHGLLVKNDQGELDHPPGIIERLSSKGGRNGSTSQNTKPNMETVPGVGSSGPGGRVR